MNWPKIIGNLKTKGLSQALVGQLCGCAQATISDLAKVGGTNEPRYSLGKKLEVLDAASEAELADILARGSVEALDAAYADEQTCAERVG